MVKFTPSRICKSYGKFRVALVSKSGLWNEQYNNIILSYITGYKAWERHPQDFIVSGEWDMTDVHMIHKTIEYGFFFFAPDKILTSV